MTAAGIVAFFDGWELDADARHYLLFHARRYEHLLRAVLTLEPAPRRILDIGPSFQTILLREALPQAAVDTLGFEDPRFPPRPGDTHIQYDLNHSPDRASWPAGERYDLVIMAEVIEHLYTAARPVLECVRGMLCPSGVLLIQTPNPVRLGRRFAVLRGVSPFDLIREDRRNPGHYCEFRLEELESGCTGAGFEVVHAELANYFRPMNAKERIYDLLCALLPGRLHDGITVIARSR